MNKTNLLKWKKSITVYYLWGRILALSFFLLFFEACSCSLPGNATDATVDRVVDEIPLPTDSADLPPQIPVSGGPSSVPGSPSVPVSGGPSSVPGAPSVPVSGGPSSVPGVPSVPVSGGPSSVPGAPSVPVSGGPSSVPGAPSVPVSGGPSSVPGSPSVPVSGGPSSVPGSPSVPVSGGPSSVPGAPSVPVSGGPSSVPGAPSVPVSGGPSSVPGSPSVPVSGGTPSPKSPIEDPGAPPSFFSSEYPAWRKKMIVYLKDKFFGENEASNADLKKASPKFELSINQLTFTRSDTSPYTFVSFKSDVDWFATVEVEWLSMSKILGKASESTDFTLTLGPNPSTSKRETNITFNSAMGTKKLRISQLGARFQVTEEKVSAVALEKTYTLHLSGDADWTAQVSDTNWMKIVGSDSGTVGGAKSSRSESYLLIKENDTANTRLGKLVFTYADDKKVVIDVEQSSDKFEIVGLSTMNVLRKPATYDVELAGDSVWWASADVSWLSLSVTSATLAGFSTISLYVNQENIKDVEDVANIFFHTDAGNVKTLKIIQRPTRLNVITETSLDVSGIEGARTIRFTGDADWTATSSVSWLSVEKSTGVVVDNDSIDISFERNNDATKWGSVVISYKGTPDRIVVVKQGENCVDCDGNGLIDLNTIEDLNRVRYSYKDSLCTKVLKTRPDGDALSKGCPEKGCHGYELKADLDFANSVWASGNSAKGWEPIGTQSSPFISVLEGNNHTVSNLYINRPEEDNVGLFSFVRGNIKNLGLINARIIGKSNVGTVVGVATGGNLTALINLCKRVVFGFKDRQSDWYYLLSNVYAKDSIVEGKGNNVGGLVGFIDNEEHIVNSYYYGNVSGGKDEKDAYQKGIGGIVGSVHSSNILNSHAWAKIEGVNEDAVINVGGIVGKVQNSIIVNSYFNGSISKGYSLGGIVGNILSEKSQSKILSSYANAQIDVSDAVYVGGLAGSFDTNVIHDNTKAYPSFNSFSVWIRDSYAITNFNGDANLPYIGGLVGYFYFGSIKNTYAASTVTQISSHTIKFANLIGKVAENVLKDPLLWSSINTIRNVYYIVQPRFACKNDDTETRPDCSMPGAINVNLGELITLTTDKMTWNSLYTVSGNGYNITYSETNIWQEASWERTGKNIPRVQYTHCSNKGDLAFDLPSGIKCGDKLPMQLTVVWRGDLLNVFPAKDFFEPDYTLPISYYYSLGTYKYNYFLGFEASPCSACTNKFLEYRERIKGEEDWNLISNLSKYDATILVRKEGIEHAGKIYQYQYRYCLDNKEYMCSGWSPTYEVELKKTP